MRAIRQGTASNLRVALADASTFVVAMLAVLYPIGLSLLRYGTAAPFKFFAADAFYYLNIARRSTSLAFYSYDGQLPTNGFHPLWQWFLTTLFKHLALSQPSDRQLLIAYLAGGALVAIGCGFVALAAARLTGSRWLALLCAVPGLYDILFSKLIFSTVDGTETAPWAWVNGMESGFSALWFGLFAWLLMQSSALADWSLLRVAGASIVLTLITLSRLDDVFLLVAFGGALLLATHDRRDRRPVWQTGLAIGVVPGITLASYLLYNLRTTRMALPVSGSMKSDFGVLAANLRGAVQCLIPTWLFADDEVFFWDGMNWRVLQLLVPMLVAACFVGYLLLAGPPQGERSVARTHWEALRVLAFYVLLKGAYNLVAVPLYSQGHWYFTASAITTNLLLGFMLCETVRVPMPALAAEWQGRLQLALRYLGFALILLGLMLSFAAGNRGRLVFGLLVIAAPGFALVRWSQPAVRALARLSRERCLQIMHAKALLAVLAFIVMQGNAVVNQKGIATSYGDVNYEFWQARQRIMSDLRRIAPQAKLYEHDDGVMAYALDMPAMSGTGLAVDADSRKECRLEHCLDVGYRRGYRVISSVQYWGHANEQRLNFVRPDSEPGIIDYLVGERGREVPLGAERFDFSLLHRVNVGNHVVYFLSFKPKS